MQSASERAPSRRASTNNASFICVLLFFDSRSTDHVWCKCAGVGRRRLCRDAHCVSDKKIAYRPPINRSRHTRSSFFFQPKLDAKIINYACRRLIATCCFLGRSDFIQRSQNKTNYILILQKYVEFSCGSATTVDMKLSLYGNAIKE